MNTVVEARRAMHYQALTHPNWLDGGSFTLCVCGRSWEHHDQAAQSLAMADCRRCERTIISRGGHA